MLIRVRAYLPEIFFGALLATAIFGMGMLFGSSGHQPTQSQSNQHATQTVTQKDAHPPKPFSGAWYLHDATGFFTLALVIVVGIQAVLLLWQLCLINRTMRDQAEATRAAGRSAEAARKSLFLSNPPRLVIRNIRIWAGADPSEPPDLVPDKALDGFAWVLSAGSAPTVIRHQKCIVGWHVGELPMLRPFDNKNFGSDTFPWRDCEPLRTMRADGTWPETKRMNYDSIAKLVFKTTVPSGYTGAMSLYLMGYLAYEIEGLEFYRILRFARRYDLAQRRFVAVENNPDYEGHD